MPPRSARSTRATTPTRRVRGREGRVLSRTWQFAAMLRSGKPGRLRGLRDGGESLFCIGAATGSSAPSTMSASTARTSCLRAKARPRVVVCPYHAWTYELTGGCAPRPTRRRCRASTSRDLPDRGAHRGLPGLRLRQSRPRCRADGRLVPGARAELEAFVPHWADLQPLEWVEIPRTATGRSRSRTTRSAITARSTTRPLPPA
jgi:hypothetical protein